MRSKLAPVGILPTLAIGALLVGCRQELMPTPNLYIQSQEDPFRAVPPALQTSKVEVIYATDRAPLQDRSGRLQYGYQRSKSLAFGVCVVEIGRDLAWEELVRESRAKRRSQILPLRVAEIRETGRFPAVPDLAAFENGKLIARTDTLEKEKTAEQQLQSLLAEHLSLTPHHDVYVYIHGFSNTFEDAAFVMAGIWHFMGRTGVPIIYTWPAGSPEGALGGYTHDSESGQFTGYHLRHFLQSLAACPQIKRIHLVAHSRGTDVLMTALRELNIEYRAAGKKPRSELKLGNLVLAAADLDFEVTSQRITAELLPLMPERMTVYVSTMDRAIGAADILFGSKRRIGQLRYSDLSPDQQKALAAVSQMHIIDVRARTGFLGHSYFHASPAVSSDLILLLRDNLSPGAENGRPLVKRQSNFWEIDDAYPRGPGS